MVRWVSAVGAAQVVHPEVCSQAPASKEEIAADQAQDSMGSWAGL